ncbi:MAG TPA: sugar ABC transporter ATP-binding protein [Chitinophagaceae bacterium]|jgi:ribose transport system ATP-binding protein
MLAGKHISKKFGGVPALADINLELYPGRVNAIIGENGAGKSTLMKILSGVYTQYEGEIIYNGAPVRFSTPKDAERAGIAIIHQELNLVPWLSVAENIFLGRELLNGWGLLDKRKMNEEAKTLLMRLNLAVDPGTKISALKVGQQQLVEIARALYVNASVIIMDEPTSAISDKEVDQLFSIIRELKAEGKIIVYISHKLKELFTIADRFIVLRDGRMIDAGDMAAITEEELIRKMTGRQLLREPGRPYQGNTEELLFVKNISLRHPVIMSARVLDNISFTLQKGEILGIYGLMGAGRTELLETIFGLHPGKASGEVYVNKRVRKIKSPVQAIRAGIALVPEDRKLQGLVLNQSVRANMSITILHKLEQWGIMLNRGKESKMVNGYINRLSIKTASLNNAAKDLSGGNQQKIVLAKWLATEPGILLLDEPTRGIDINAKTEIYKLMRALAAEGLGIIMVSSELPEILTVSDRVLVMSEGSLAASIPIGDASEEKILKYAIHKNQTAQ